MLRQIDNVSCRLLDCLRRSEMTTLKVLATVVPTRTFTPVPTPTRPRSPSKTPQTDIIAAYEASLDYGTGRVHD